MRVFMILLCMSVAWLSSCHAHNRGEAIKLSNTFTDISDSLFYKGRAFGKQVAGAYQAKDYAALAATRKDFDAFVTSSHARVEGMKDVGGSEALRHCLLELLEVELAMSAKDFSPFELLTPETTGEQVEKMFETVKKDAERETSVLNRLKALQAAYAKDNGFELKFDNPQ